MPSPNAQSPNANALGYSTLSSSTSDTCVETFDGIDALRMDQSMKGKVLRQPYLRAKLDRYSEASRANGLDSRVVGFGRSEVKENPILGSASGWLMESDHPAKPHSSLRFSSSARFS